MIILSTFWKFLEAMAEGRRMRVEKQVQEYIRNQRI